MAKVAIVTGSTSGIGLAIAESLAAAGYSVVINSFSDTEADHAVAAQIATKGEAKTVYRQADMSKPDQCRDLVAWTLKELGSVEILVNNAGIQHVAPVEDFPVEQWDRIIAINLSSTFHTTAAALPFMKKAGYGRIVNIASAHGLRASPNKSAYVAAKHGVVGFTKTVALETAQRRHHLQRHLPRLRADPPGRNADRRPGEGARPRSRDDHPQRDPGEAAQQAVRHRGGNRRGDDVPGVRWSGVGDRNHHLDRRRLDRAVAQPPASRGGNPSGFDRRRDDAHDTARRGALFVDRSQSRLHALDRVPEQI